jgi:phosphoglycerol transferase MdoB-like AlkP superfamily enzyme
MKEKLTGANARFIIINLAFLPMLPFLRIAEYYFLSPTPEFPGNAIAVEAIGLIHDLFSLAIFALVMFIPFVIIYYLHKRSSVIFYISLLCVFTVLQIAIIKYFSIALTPLDETIFSYSFKEIMLIIKTSDDLNLISFLPMILSVMLILFLQFIFRNVVVKRFLPFFIGGFGLATFLFGIILPSGAMPGEPLFTYYMKVNKCSYFIKRSIGSLSRSSIPGSTEELSKAIEKYHSAHPEFKFTGDKYPLFHTLDTPDVLGPFFRLSPRPPNLVFIIVESLSSAHLGDSSWFGNFTPFLDSLKNKGLYWDNFVSTSERTFHVLQALFGSLPYGHGEFQKDKAVMPDHYSLIRTLRENGYYSSFFYGGDAGFTNYDQFLEKQGLDFLLRYFGPKYDKMLHGDENFKWGYQDEALFERSLEVLDSLKKEPRMDIYLTLSTHLPFHPPRAEYYLDQVQKILNKPGFPGNKRMRSAQFKELFSSVLYTDEAIRSFIKAYSKRNDYNNTIFFITGDHSFTEFGNSPVSAIEHYHVPMIIFSPLLKGPRHFNSVSSHLDITPSVLAMLCPAYNFKEEKYSHWLGQGLDTSVGYRNIHTLAVTQKSNETVDYLKNDYYYSDGLLYKVGEGLRTTAVNDELKRQEMSDELSATVKVYNYTNQNNLLVPSGSFMSFGQERESIRVYKDSTLKRISPGQTCLDLLSPSEFRSNYRKINVDIRFRYMISEAADTSRFPLLIASIEDNNFKKLIYHSLKFPDISTGMLKPGGWYSMHLNENMDVSMIDFLKGRYLKLYFYYHNPCGIQFDGIQVRLSGTK